MSDTDRYAGANQKLIITHSLFIGLTRLIPAPFVDDLAKSYFQRRMVAALANARGQSIPQAEVQILAREPDQGCLWGCFTTLLLFPVKLIFRIAFLLLEWKHTVDLVSRSYHYGYLIDYAFSQRWIYPAGPHSATDVRIAIDEVIQAAPTRPLDEAIKRALLQSRDALKAIAGPMQKALRRMSRRSNDEQIAEIAGSVEVVEGEAITGIVTRVQQAIEKLPDEHLRKLRVELTRRLGTANRDASQPF